MLAMSVCVCMYIKCVSSFWCKYRRLVDDKKPLWLLAFCCQLFTLTLIKIHLDLVHLVAFTLHLSVCAFCFLCWWCGNAKIFNAKQPKINIILSQHLQANKHLMPQMLSIFDGWCNRCVFELLLLLLFVLISVFFACTVSVIFYVYFVMFVFLNKSRFFRLTYLYTVRTYTHEHTSHGHIS